MASWDDFPAVATAPPSQGEGWDKFPKVEDDPWSKFPAADTPPPKPESPTPASDKAFSETPVSPAPAFLTPQQMDVADQKMIAPYLAEAATGVAQGVKEMVPKSVGAAAKMLFYTPIEETPHAIKEAYDVIRGVPIEQAVPESQTYKGFTQKPLTEQAKIVTGQVLPLALGLTGLRESLRPKIGEPSASEIPSPESVPQPEIRPPVGEEAPLRQQGETAGTQEPIVAEPPQETPQLVRQTPTGPELAQPEVSEPVISPAAKPTEVPVRGTQADVAQAREAAGLDPYERDLQRSWGDAAEVSRKKVTRYQGYEERLAQEIDKKPRPVTDDEHVSLLRNWQKAEVEHQMAVDAVNQAPDPITKNMAQDALATAKDKLEQAVGAIDKSGSAAGRGFNIRKMILKEFYTPERMESRVRAAKGGKALTEDEVKQVNDYSDQMRKARVESAKAESQRAADARYADRANGSVGRKVNGVKSIKDVHDVLASEAEAARRRILSKRGSMEWKDKVDPCVL